MDIDALLARVPDYKEFYGVDELYGHAVRVAKANPALVADTIAQVKTALGM